MSPTLVTIVDEHDQELGVMEKMEAHKLGILHRAFSVFIFNNRGEMLLQQRSFKKYHSAGLWTNTCCGHPNPGEITIDGANRRLKEEMGFSTELKEVFNFTYRSVFENGLTENEIDHVFTGVYDGNINPDPSEVSTFSYRKVSEIKMELQISQKEFTTWFRIAFPMLEKIEGENFG